ncbi:MAG: universal stress protein [Rhodospirillales bacterium]|nr:universal stress protein [Rhodospirillales bacterium]
MSIRKVLVPIDGSDASRQALAAGFALGRRFGAHVEVLHPRIDPIDAVTFAGEGMSGEVVQELVELTERQAEGRAAVARAMYEEACAAAGIGDDHPQAGRLTGSYHDPVAREQDAVSRFGRLTDLIVVARPKSGESNAYDVLHAALFGSAHPVLVAGTAAPAEVYERVLVAWNGSVESARAVSAALPLLVAAGQVTVVHTDELEQGTSSQDVVNYLACHSIAATALALPASQPVADSLLEATRKADLLVMGAYTHGRLWQLIVGGVTRKMLEAADIPLLMAH